VPVAWYVRPESGYVAVDLMLPSSHSAPIVLTTHAAIDLSLRPCGLRRGATALRSTAVEQQSSANGHIGAVGGRRAIASRQPDPSRSVELGNVGLGSWLCENARSEAFARGPAR
jgi:hypothetical protein